MFWCHFYRVELVELLLGYDTNLKKSSFSSPKVINFLFGKTLFFFLYINVACIKNLKKDISPCSGL